MGLSAQVVHDNIYIPIGHVGEEKSADAMVLGGNSFIIDGNGTTGGHITVFSGTSIVLKEGFHAKKGSVFSAKVGELSVPNLSPVPDLNWVRSRIFDGDRKVIAESKSFADYLGRTVQTQSRNVTDSKVIVSQTIYDDKGRAALTSMPVPINQSTLDYKNGLMCDNMGHNYSLDDFDTPSTLNQPKRVNSSIPNTLGWYYSNNNSREKHVATTKYPYSRVDYSRTIPGKVKRSADAGEAFRMGSGREVVSFTMSASDEELFEQDFFKQFVDSDDYNKYKFLLKTVSQDAQGRQVVSYTTADGLLVASCMSGKRDDDGDENVHMVSHLVPVKWGYWDKGLSADYCPPGQSDSGPPADYCPPGQNEDGEFIMIYPEPVETAFLDVHIPVGTNSITLSTDNYDIIDLVSDKYIKCDASLSGTFTFSSAQLNRSRFYRIRSKSGDFTLDQELNYYHHSFNVYDEAGRLIKSYSPKAVAAKNADMCTTYKYNSLGWLLESESPDQGKTEFKYRKDGQIRFSQNALQHSKKKVSFTNYDELGRPIESGVFRCGEDGYDELSDLNYDEEIVEYCEEQLYTLYDIPDSKLPSTVSKTQDYLLGKVSKTSNEHSTTWYSYTYDGNVAWVIQKLKDLPNQLFCMEYTYDFTGNVKRVVYQSGKEDQFIHTYTYDPDNRLSRVYAGPSDTDLQEQAHYHYYEHGPLKRVELADNLQGIDYVYTLQGALKSINHPNLDGNDPGKDGFSGTHSAFKKDVFALGLDYYSGDYARSGTNISSGHGVNYAGNINAMRWKTRDLANDNAGSVQNMYQFAYYKNNWLKQGVFGSFNQGSKHFAAKQDYKVENLTYDANGNIVSLNRNGYGEHLAMDKLNYHYIGSSNKLDYVSDAEGDAGMQDMSSQSSGNYEYDAIGQMTDNKQDGHYFDYDASGKVIAVYANAAKTDWIAQYKYDDRGFRVKKEDLKQGETTYYIRDLSGNIMAIYSDRDGKSIDTPEEYALYGSGRLGLARVEPGKLSYIYELADHLGNVRATVKKEDDGSLGLISQADYYPFGMLMPGRTIGSNEYRFGYQGQFAEKDEETGYNSFELRLWDGRLGRWLSTDPYGQYASSYLGMGNNPVNRIDADGGLDDWFVGKNKGEVVHAPNYGKNDVAALSQETGMDLNWFAKEGALGISAELSILSSTISGSKGFISLLNVENSIKLMDLNGFEMGPSLMKYVWKDRAPLLGELGMGRMGRFDIDSHTYTWLEKTYYPKGSIFSGEWKKSASVNKLAGTVKIRTIIGTPKFDSPTKMQHIGNVHKIFKFWQSLVSVPGPMTDYNYQNIRTIK